MATRSAQGYTTRVAASKAVMRSGRHFAQFTVLAGKNIFFGVIRPGWDVEGGVSAHNVDGHCFYWTVSGGRYPPRQTHWGALGGIEWEGQQTAKQGDRIGMLLDLDQGSMTVWKGDVLLGVLITFIAILAASAIMVYPTAMTIGKHWPKGWKHVVFWSGLKGSIPLALVLGLPDGELKSTLVPIAFGVVLVSLLLQGLTVGPLIRFIGVSSDDH